MRRELPFKAPGGLVERHVDVLAGTVGTNLTAPRVANDLHAMAPLGANARVVLEDHLDLDALDPVVEARDPPQPPLRDGPVVVGDVGSSALENEIHRRLRGRAPAWLTWSLAPHSPAEGIAAMSAA